MKNILNNKLLIILTLFAVILGFGTNVFASYEIPATYNDEVYTLNLPDWIQSNNYKFQCYAYVNNYNTLYYTFFVTTNGVKITSAGEYGKQWTSLCTDSQLVFQKVESFSISNQNVSTICSSLNSKISSYLSSEKMPTSGGTEGIDNFNVSGVRCYWGNIDLLNNSGEVVFQGAPQVQEQEETTILAPIVEQAETERVTEEIVGLLPLIVALLVSIIAIYKAIRHLQSVLRTS